VSRNGLRRGRSTGLIVTGKRKYSSGQSEKIPKQLVNLAEWTSQNPQRKVDRKVYNLLYDVDMYMLAYNKLKSNPGNLTPGITPETLDGLSHQ